MHHIEGLADDSVLENVQMIANNSRKTSLLAGCQTITARFNFSLTIDGSSEPQLNSSRPKFKKKTLSAVISCTRPIGGRDTDI